MSRPWLSVVMPTYNGAALVRGALQSIADEVRTSAGHDGVEVVVIDDGSTDGTVAEVSRFEGSLDLRLVAGPRQGGWVAATNAGLRLATADHACFLHQDDRWLPGRLDAVRGLLDRHGDASLLVTAAEFADPSGRPLGRWSLPLRGTGVLTSDAFRERLLVQNFVCVAAPVFATATALDRGGLDERLWYTADWDLWLRLAKLGPVPYDARATVTFGVHDASQTARGSSDTADLRAQLETVLERHLPDWAVAHPDAARAVGRAARASVELNVALAAVSHGAAPAAGRLARAVVGLGPAGTRRLARDARLHERVAARLRARMAARRHEGRR